jgi:transmembrane sensor
MKKEQRIAFLMDCYIANRCSKEELDELLSMVDHADYQKPLQGKLKQIWEDTDQMDIHMPAEWDLLYTDMMAKANQLEKASNKRLLWRKVAVAASVLICLSVTMLIYKNPSGKLQPSQSLSANQQITPGGNKAVLTLANGAKIVLDASAKGIIASQAGVQISKTSDGQLIYQLKNDASTLENQMVYNTIETPRGGQYQINMPDGTKVWLNAMSSLKYPVAFNNRERKVELVGEAYFEVAKNKKVPFIVQSAGQKVQVLGTHFNINAYSDEGEIQTTLLEGAVNVLSDGQTAKLSPGQQSVLKAHTIAVKNVDVELAVAWKNGNFIFNKDNLDDIMRQLSRWYDVDVVYQHEPLKKVLLSGSVSRFENIAQVLDIIELTQLVHFKVEGRRIIVMK